MEFFLNISELEYLLKNLRQSNMRKILAEAQKKGEHQVKGQYATKKYSLNLSKEQTSDMTDELSSLLMEKGFEKNWEPNEVGFQLEKLIDKFNTKSSMDKNIS